VVLSNLSKFFAFSKKCLSKVPAENWDPSLINNGMQRPEGIYKLVKGQSYSPTFKKKWAEFSKTYKEN
jgi:hypothetical protein